MRIRTGCCVSSCLVALSAFSLAAATAGADPLATPASPVVGHTYIDDNTAVSNAVSAYDRHADESLMAIPGSPFASGGAGLGAGLGSQGAIQPSIFGATCSRSIPGATRSRCSP